MKIMDVDWKSRPISEEICRLPWIGMRKTPFSPIVGIRSHGLSFFRPWTLLTTKPVARTYRRAKFSSSPIIFEVSTFDEGTIVIWFVTHTS